MPGEDGMTSNEIGKFGLCCGVCCALFLAGFYAGASLASDAERQAAIKAGVARYAVDPTTGAVRFEYINGSASHE